MRVSVRIASLVVFVFWGTLAGWGLWAFEAVGPVCPSLESRWPYGPCRAVAVQDNRAYIGNGTVFTIVDITDPLLPAHAGEVELPGLVEAIALDLPLAYLADGAGEFQVVHTGTPNAPYIFSSLKLWSDTESAVTDVAHAGNYCYAVDGQNLYIIDVTDPARPARRGWTYEVPGATSLALRGNYAVTVGGTGLFVVDLLDPDEPKVVGSWTGSWLFQPDVEVQGNHAFVSDRYGKFFVVDITNPLSPSLVATLDSLSPPPQGVSLGTGYAYLPAGTGGVHVIELDNPALPRLHYTQDTPGEARRAAVAADHLYLADGGGGLRTFVAGGILQSLGTFATAGPVQDARAVEGYLYLADSGFGLRILELQSRGALAEVGSVATPGTARGVAVTGNHISGQYAVMADTGEGIRVLDVNDPAHPFEAGSRWTFNQAWSVDAAWPYAYLGTGYGLNIFDLSDPANPAYVGGYRGPGGVFDLAASGAFVYAACGYAGVQVYSVANPAEPSIWGSVTTLNYPSRVSFSENYLYVVDSQGTARGVHVFDAANPAQLVKVATFGPPSTADIQVSGNTALVVDQEEGLHLFDVTNPHTPVEVGAASTPGIPSCVALWQNRAAVASADAGVSLLDLSTPCLPGDCDLDGAVSIGEVQKAINMFLGIIPPDCGVDCSGDGTVSIGEVQKVINGFLGVPTSC
jgi:hypothetical protein